MTSCISDFKSQLDIQEDNLTHSLMDLGRMLRTNESKENLIEWSTPLSASRKLIETLSRVVGVRFHLKNQKLSDEYILKSITDSDKIHSFKLVKFAAGVQLGCEYDDKTNNINLTVFSPFVEESPYWFSENVSNPTHASSDPHPIANSENYNKFKNVFEKLVKIFEKLSEEFTEDSYFSSRLTEVKEIAARANNLYALSWPETVELCKLCKRIPLKSNEVRYVAFAPDSFDNEEDMLLFTRINWHMVFDPNQNNEGNKLLSFVKKIMGESPIQLMTDKANLHKSSNKINWFFPFGERERSSSVKPFIILLRKKINEQNDENYIIVDFNESSKKGLSAKMFESFVKGVFDEIYCPTNDAKPSSFNRNCHFITLKNSIDDDNKLNDYINKAIEEEENNLSPGRINYLDFGVSKFLNSSAAAGLLNSVIVGSEKGLPFLNSEFIKDCNSAGISFMLPDDESKPGPLNDFVCGHKIHYSELKLEKDVVRMRATYEDFKRKIRDAINNQILIIAHQPGAGGTTMSRRLAYDLSEGGKSLNYLAVFLRDVNNINNTKTKLHRLSDEFNNKRIIIISEDDIDDGTYKKLKELLIASKNFVHVRVIHSYQRLAGESIFLQAQLDEEEKNLFLDKYRGYFLEKERNSADVKRIDEIYSRIDNMENVQVVDFPYSFTESFIKKEGLAKESIVPERGKYVKSEINKLSENIKEFVKYVAFSYYFTNQGITASTLKSIWDDGGEIISFERSFTPNEKKHVFNLLKKEEGESKNSETIWSPRYSAFASEILISIFGEKERWPLSKLSEDFLTKLPAPTAGEPEGSLKSLLESMFIQQAKIYFKIHSDSCVDLSKDDNKRGYKSKFEDRFSSLIGRVYSNSGIIPAKRIFDALINKYPEGWHYYAHKGRLLFESAAYEKQEHNASAYDEAESCISSAEEGLGTEVKSDDVVMHIHGMLYLRRLQALGYNLRDASDNVIIDYVSVGEECFKESINLNLASPYGWMSLGTLYRDAILLGASIHNKEKIYIKRCDKSVREFCEKESLYLDYVKGLDEAVGALSSFNFKENDREYQGYDSLRVTLAELYGHTKEQILMYEKKFNNALGVSNSSRIYFGNALKNCLKNISWNNYKVTTPAKTKRREKTIYSNMGMQEVEKLKGVLNELIALGDLDAHYELFKLNRFSKRYDLLESIEALSTWRNAAMASVVDGDIKSKRSILWSNYYLGVAYSALLISSDRPDTEMQKKVNECFTNARKMAKPIGAELYCRIDVLGKDHKHTWDSIIPYYEAYQDEDTRGMKPQNSCIRVSAQILDVDNPEARVGQLDKVSFRGELFSPDYVGKTILDATVNFTFGGPGLYNFDVKAVGKMSVDSNLTTEDESLKESALSEPSITNTNGDQEIGLKILGKIDIVQSEKIEWKKSKQFDSKQDNKNLEEYQVAKEGVAYMGILLEGKDGFVYPNDNLCNERRPEQRLRFIHIHWSENKDLKSAWINKDKVSFQIKYYGDKVYAIKLRRED